MSTTYLIRERVLTDDVLHVADHGRVFKGGYVAILEHHTFRNANADDAHVRRFRTLEAAAKEIGRRYRYKEVAEAGLPFEVGTRCLHLRPIDVDGAVSCKWCDYCPECEDVTVWDGETCTDCGRVWGGEGEVVPTKYPGKIYLDLETGEFTGTATDDDFA